VRRDRHRFRRASRPDLGSATRLWSRPQLPQSVRYRVFSLAAGDSQPRPTGTINVSKHLSMSGFNRAALLRVEGLRVFKYHFDTVAQGRFHTARFSGAAAALPYRPHPQPTLPR